MSTTGHKRQSHGEWYQKPFLEQMAHIGSEVYRAISWRGRNDGYASTAFNRSLELFDLTKNSKLTYPQYRELLRVREIWVDYFTFDNQYNSTKESINNYFKYITIALRNGT